MENDEMMKWWTTCKCIIKYIIIDFIRFRSNSIAQILSPTGGLHDVNILLLPAIVDYSRLECIDNIYAVISIIFIRVYLYLLNFTFIVYLLIIFCWCLFLLWSYLRQSTYKICLISLYYYAKHVVIIFYAAFVYFYCFSLL